MVAGSTQQVLTIPPQLATQHMQHEHGLVPGCNNKRRNRRHGVSHTDCWGCGCGCGSETEPNHVPHGVCALVGHERLGRHLVLHCNAGGHRHHCCEQRLHRATDSQLLTQHAVVAGSSEQGTPQAGAAGSQCRPQRRQLHRDSVRSNGGCVQRHRRSEKSGVVEAHAGVCKHTHSHIHVMRPQPQPAPQPHATTSSLPPHRCTARTNKLCHDPPRQSTIHTASHVGRAAACHRLRLEAHEGRHNVHKLVCHVRLDKPQCVGGVPVHRQLLPHDGQQSRARPRVFRQHVRCSLTLRVLVPVRGVTRGDETTQRDHEVQRRGSCRPPHQAQHQARNTAGRG